MVDLLELNGESDLVLAVLDSIPQMQTPALCEIWNWQGDTSVLPYKFESVLNAASTDPIYAPTELKN